jgi:hypothetical protein
MIGAKKRASHFFQSKKMSWSAAATGDAAVQRRQYYVSDCYPAQILSLTPAG